MLERLNVVLSGYVGESALDSDRTESLNYDRQALEQQGALAVVEMRLPKLLRTRDQRY